MGEYGVVILDEEKRPLFVSPIFTSVDEAADLKDQLQGGTIVDGETLKTLRKRMMDGYK